MQYTYILQNIEFEPQYENDYRFPTISAKNIIIKLAE